MEVFNPPTEVDLFLYRAKVTGVYDGDTVRVDIDLGFNNWILDAKLRLYGVNTPELKGDTKEAAVEIRDVVRKWFDIERDGTRWGSTRIPKTILLRTIMDRGGKYGRMLAVLFVAEEDDGGYFCVNEKLIEMGHKAPDSWL